MLRRRQRHCAACSAPVEQRPTCPSCGEPYVPEAAGFESPRAGAVLSSVLAGAVALGPLALFAALAVEGVGQHGAGALGSGELVRLVVTWLPSGLAFLWLPGAALAQWVTRVITRSRMPAEPPLRRAPKAGLVDGVRLTVRGRVRLRLPPLEGRPRTAAAARSARICTGSFDIVLDDGSVVAVDDSDVVLGSRRIVDWLSDSVDLRDGDEVVASGPVRALDGSAGGYRDAGRTLAFDGHAVDPVRLIKVAGPSGVAATTEVTARAQRPEPARGARVRVGWVPDVADEHEEPEHLDGVAAPGSSAMRSFARG